MSYRCEHGIDGKDCFICFPAPPDVSEIEYADFDRPCRVCGTFGQHACSPPPTPPVVAPGEREGWAKWWFIHGGSLHGMWKRRQYEEIHQLAKDLPMLAWDAATVQMQAEIETWQGRARINGLRGFEFQDRAESAEAELALEREKAKELVEALERVSKVMLGIDAKARSDLRKNIARTALAKYREEKK